MMIEVRQLHGTQAPAAERSISRVVQHVLALSVLGLGGAAFAQDNETSAPAPANRVVELDEITVTGSRIRRTTDFNTPNPTTVVDTSYLQSLGIVNVGDAIDQLPANLSTMTPATTGNSSFFTGSAIANLRGLNPFFGSRTLALVNSRRFVPTNQGDGLDLNFIPSLLIDRIDVVTGGASAAYGSGAISGVTNIFLDRRLTGGKAEADYATTEAGGGADRHLGLAFGNELFGGRGHFVVAGEFQKSDGVPCLGARSWCDRGAGFFSNPTDVNNPIRQTQPEYLLLDNLRSNQISTTGVFYGTGLQADASGTGTTAFDMGNRTNATNFFSGTTEGGSGRSIYQFTNLRAPVERKIGTALFDFEVNDRVNMTVDLSYGKVEGSSIQGASNANHGFFDGTTIQADNAFLTPALAAARSQASAFGISDGWFRKDWSSQVNAFTNTTTDVKRFVLGFNGGFGSTSWTWDTYYQYGDTEREQFVNDARSLIRYQLATDAVLNAQGQTVCRVTRDGVPANATYNPLLAQGCVPLNPFGNAAISPDAKAYAFGFLRETLDYSQQVAAANVSGDVFRGVGAGPIQAALGVEYRREKGENINAADEPDYIKIDYPNQYGNSFSGKVDVTEAFLELNFPLLKDRPAVKRVELNTAVRQSQYKNKGLAGTTGESNTHDITTWKASALYDPVDWFRLRGSRSRDIRAANFRELYYQQNIAAGGSFGYSDFPTNRDLASWNLQGNVNLDPEEANTTTIGFVLTPQEGFAQGFQFAADYFKITIEGAITPADVFRVVDGCRIDNLPEFCSLLSFGDPAEVDATDPKSNITNIQAFAYNGREYLTKGIDFSSSYTRELGDGTISVRLIATRMIDQIVQPVAAEDPIDITGMTGTNQGLFADFQSSPDWIANLSSTWLRGPLSLTGQVRFVSEGTMDYDGTDPSDAGFSPTDDESYTDNSVPSYFVFNTSAAYTFEKVFGVSSFQVFGVIDNLFDKEPPIATGAGFGAGNGGTNPIFFDTMGRSYRLGLRMSF